MGQVAGWRQPFWEAKYSDYLKIAQARSSWMSACGMMGCRGPG